jgi:hypothetical protein
MAGNPMMKELTEKIRAFARDRDWEQFHSPKNLAMALSVEVAEVVEHFQWLFHEDVLFENWTGARIRGRDNLEKAWVSWFKNHGGFRFTEEDTFIDEAEQKVLYRWQLEWPSWESGYEGGHEVRRGVDLLHFKDGKIIKKLTYCKTTLEIGGQRIPLSA